MSAIGKPERVAKVATTVHEGRADDIPEALKRSPSLRAIYNNLKPTMQWNVGSSLADGPLFE